MKKSDPRTGSAFQSAVRQTKSILQAYPNVNKVGNLAFFIMKGNEKWTL